MNTKFLSIMFYFQAFVTVLSPRININLTEIKRFVMIERIMKVVKYFFFNPNKTIVIKF